MVQFFITCLRRTFESRETWAERMIRADEAHSEARKPRGLRRPFTEA